MSKKDEIVEWRRLHEVFHSFYRWVIKYRRLRRTGHITRMEGDIRDIKLDLQERIV